jgi:hypothetical protein
MADDFAQSHYFIALSTILRIASETSSADRAASTRETAPALPEFENPDGPCHDSNFSRSKRSSFGTSLWDCFWRWRCGPSQHQRTIEQQSYIDASSSATLLNWRSKAKSKPRPYLIRQCRIGKTVLTQFFRQPRWRITSLTCRPVSQIKKQLTRWRNRRPPFKDPTQHRPSSVPPGSVTKQAYP